MASTVQWVQENGDGLSAEIEAQERRQFVAMHELMEANAELDRLRAQQRVQHMTPTERRADIRRRNTSVRKTLAAVGILGLAEFVRSHRRAAVASAMAMSAAGAVAVAPGATTDLMDAMPDEPPVVATPSPRTTDPPDASGTRKMPGEPPTIGPLDLEVQSGPPSTVGSGEPSGESGPGPTPRPTATDAPLPPSPSGTPHPPPVETPPPEPPLEPSPAPEPPDSPAPAPTPTPEPPAPPNPPPPPPPPAEDAALLCLELELGLVLEAGACVDLDLPLLDGILGG